MSWLQKLHDTYEVCKGHEPEGSAPLMPTSHTTQQAQIEIVLDGNGQFRRAVVLEKSLATTLIPCTEESGGRAGSKPVNHPLCDKLQYLAGDYLKFGGEVTSGFAKDPEQPHRDYLKSLSAWAASASGNPKLGSILSYVKQNTLVADLARAGVLHLDSANATLLKAWPGDKALTPPIYKVLAAGQTQEDAFVRWRVEAGDDPNSATWTDEGLMSGWTSHYQSTQTKRGYCMVTGQETALAVQHPAKLRHGGDKAKLISANDSTGYTYRGKFISADEALGVGFVATQKAHNALRWLIARQGYRRGDQVFVAWEMSGKQVPDPFASTFESFGGEAADWTFAGSVANAGQAFALKLKSAVSGYRAKLDPKDQVMLIGLDSATPGRMAITYYRELRSSEFLARIEAWHLRFAWAQNFGKDRKFIGAPAPRDIAEAAFGSRLDETLRSATVERLLPCIVDGMPFPIDLLKSTVRRASNRVGLERWEWEKCLGIACALFKGLYTEGSYLMALEQERTSRDYLFGRLLAMAEHIEGRALFVAGEKRDTTAARLMQRFADRPSSTWKTIWLALQPYMTRLRNNRPGFLHAMGKQIDDVIAAFKPDDFTRDTALSGEFLLGYHCQRQALRPPENATDDEATADTADTTTTNPGEPK
ncbi:MAG: type I-C CRISPR-associated protein Cas8c/Csd1 [Burkholderiaceae bacterium]|nr:type I-C CRISPR-associated protein Cas8c/Csd1 [Burkholderiaceae bacterium]